MSCPYFQNSELITIPGGLYADGKPSSREAESLGLTVVSEDEVIEHLTTHRGRIEGLAITGGEPTLQPDLPDFCRRIKALGLLVKLDTNGTNPAMLSALIADGLVDYVAMDVKLPTAAYNVLLPQDASAEAKARVTESVRESIGILKRLPSGKGAPVDADDSRALEGVDSRGALVDYEIRTTVVDEFFDDDVMRLLGRELSGIKQLYLQPYRDSDTVLISGLHSPSDEKLLGYRDILLEYIPRVEIRGADL